MLKYESANTANVCAQQLLDPEITSYNLNFDRQTNKNNDIINMH